MANPIAVRLAHAPPREGPAHGVLGWICTSNPFYVLSAGLFLAGLWLSYGAQDDDAKTWALMSGLAGYTLLLASTACFLVRLANVWDDVRTVLLLVVLMFLATSVTFDEVLVMKPDRGYICSVLGFLLAVAVSEGILRGTGLVLPVAFRVPYYLILALFFLYPLALTPLPLREEPRSEAVMWALYGFCPAAGLVFLTLLPAIRLGPEYTRLNGSPWRWPLYPWTLFGLLALAVPGRAFLLCWSLHLLRTADIFSFMFGLHFLIPFGLVVAVLLLEIGLVGRLPGVQLVALLLPLGLMVLPILDYRGDLIYQVFLGHFAEQLGGDPIFVTLLAANAFYGYAWMRGVPRAADFLTGALAGLALIGPDSLHRGLRGTWLATPLLLAAVLQLALGLPRRSAGRCLAGAAGLLVGTLALLPDVSITVRLALAFHVSLGAILVIGAVFDDSMGRVLRGAAAAAAVIACLAVVGNVLPVWLPAAVRLIYPLCLGGLLLVYGLVLRDRVVQAGGVASLALGCCGLAWRGYVVARQLITGLDHMALGLALFVVAILVSLAKAGLLGRWFAARGWIVPAPIPVPAATETPDEA